MKKKKVISLLLALGMIFSMVNIPGFAAYTPPEGYTLTGHSQISAIKISATAGQVTLKFDADPAYTNAWQGARIIVASPWWCENVIGIVPDDSTAWDSEFGSAPAKTSGVYYSTDSVEQATLLSDGVTFSIPESDSIPPDSGLGHSGYDFGYGATASGNNYTIAIAANGGDTYFSLIQLALPEDGTIDTRTPLPTPTLTLAASTLDAGGLNVKASVADDTNVDKYTVSFYAQADTSGTGTAVATVDLTKAEAAAGKEIGAKATAAFPEAGVTYNAKVVAKAASGSATYKDSAASAVVNAAAAKIKPSLTLTNPTGITYDATTAATGMTVTQANYGKANDEQTVTLKYDPVAETGFDPQINAQGKPTNAGKYKLYYDAVAETSHYKELSALSSATSTVTWTIAKAKYASVTETLTATAPSTSGGTDGKISGLDASKLYEYKGSEASDYTAVAANATEITGLAADTYSVRYKLTTAEANNYTVGDAKSVAVTAGVTTISTVGVTVTAPTSLQTPSDSAAVTAGDEAKYETSTVTWVPNLAAGATFDGATEYTATVTLTAKTGYQFAAANSVTATMNTQAATAVANAADATKLDVSYKFKTNPVLTINYGGNSTTSAQEVITSGETPESKKPATDPTWAGHTFKGWYDAATAGNVFAWDTAMTDNKTVYAQWLTNAATEVPVTAPVKGATPQTASDITVPTGAGYTVTSLTWTPAVTGTFAPSQAYTVEIVLTAATGYTFDAAATGSVTPAAASYSDNAVGAAGEGNTLTFKATYPATAGMDQQTLTILAGTGGTVENATITDDQGATVNIKAIPSTGYEFDKWTGGTAASFGDASLAETTYTIGTTNETITATFKAAELTFADQNLPAGKVGEAYSANVTAPTGGSGTYTYEATDLPVGITMSAAGAFTGMPTTASATPIVVKVTATDTVTGATKTADYTIPSIAEGDKLVLSTTIELPDKVVAGQKVTATVHEVAGETGAYNIKWYVDGVEQTEALDSETFTTTADMFGKTLKAAVEAKADSNYAGKNESAERKIYPAKPALSSKTKTSLTVTAKTGLEYAIAETNDVTTVTEWVTGTDNKVTFAELDASTTYYIFARVAADTTLVSDALSATTSSNSQGGTSSGGNYVGVNYNVGSHGVLANGSKDYESVVKGSKPKKVPEVVADYGYEFKGWSLDGEKVIDPSEETIKSATTFKAVYEKKTADPTPKPTPTPTDNPLDTENHIKYINGYEDQTVRPDNNITRAEAVAIFARLYKNPINESASYPTSFSDVDSSKWYAKYVGFMQDKGIINGYEDGTFRPEQVITRAEFAAISSRFATLTPSASNPFNDVPDTLWAKASILSAYQNGWINGYEDGTFRPERSITRAEVVKIVNTMLNRVIDANSIAGVNVVQYTDLTTSHWAYYHMIEASQAHDYTRDEKTNAETWVK